MNFNAFDATARHCGSRAALLVVLVLLVGGGGCLAPYDQKSDDGITALQQQIDARVETLAAPVASPPATTQPADPAFYKQVRSDLRLLRVRTEARGTKDPSLAKQVAILDEIAKQVDAMEALESSGLRGPRAWQTVKDGIGTNLKGFLTAELARKPATK